MANLSDVAHYYISNDLQIIPVPLGQKAPNIKSWNTVQVTADNLAKYFPSGQPGNIGVKLGPCSNNLGDLYLNNLTAVKLASKIMPPTTTFGRPGNPESHWLYEITSNPPDKTLQFQDDKGNILVELRWTRSQTVFPPSTHPSGEQVSFSTSPGDNLFAGIYAINGVELLSRIRFLVAATLIANNWPAQGSRQTTAMALSGYLLGNGLTSIQVKEFIGLICYGADDEEAKNCIKTVRDTANKIATKQPVTGYQDLVDILGEKVVKLFSKWLELKHSSTRSKNITLPIASPHPWPELDNIEIPDGFQLTENGVYRLARAPVLISGPLIVTALTLSSVDRNSGRKLRFRTLQGKDVENIIRDVDLHSKNALHGLTDQALLIIPRQSRQVVDYIMSFKELDTVINTPDIGWQEVKFEGESEVVFVTPKETFSRSELHVEFLPERAGAVDPHLSRKGTLEEWQDQVVKPCSGNPMLIFGLCASFAAPLLFWLDLGSQGYHIYGTTTRGKTTLLQVGASAWGFALDPDIPKAIAAYIIKWNATQNAVEGMAASFNDLPMCMDELGTIMAQNVSALIYNLTSGKGKQALNGNRDLRPIKTWRSVFLSTGEIQIRAKIEEQGAKAKGGQLLRFLDIPCGNSVFANTHGLEQKPFAVMLKTSCANLYGTAGPSFLTALLQSQENDADLKNQLKESLEEAKTLISSDISHKLKPEQARVLDQLAVLLLGGLTAVRLGVVPLTEAEIVASVRHVRDLWLVDSHDVDDVTRAIEAIKAFLLSQGSRFKMLNSTAVQDDTFDPRELAGYTTDDQYFIFKDVFKSKVCKGFDVNSVCAELKKSGFLVTPKDRDTCERATPQSPRTLVYVLKKSILDGADTLAGGS